MGLNLQGRCFNDSMATKGGTEGNSHLCDIPGGADVDRHRLSEDAIVEAKHCLQDQGMKLPMRYMIRLTINPISPTGRD